MGAASSHAYCGGVGGKGGLRGHYGATHHPKHSRANLGATVSAEDLLSSVQLKGEKKKRKSGLSTLKRKLGRKKKNWRAADHSRHFKESFSDKPVGLLTSILEHYEVCSAGKLDSFLAPSGAQGVTFSVRPAQNAIKVSLHLSLSHVSHRSLLGLCPVCLRSL